MSDVSSTKLQGHFIKPVPSEPGKGLTAKEKHGQNAEKVSGTDVKLSIKAKLVEFLLVVKDEAKEGFETQSAVEQQGAGGGLDMETLTYNDKPLTELSPEEAQVLVAEDGYFGVTKTAERIAEFVLSGGGDSIERLQAGREGVLQGFQEAEESWGGEMPEISSQTLNKVLEMIEAKINELGGALVDVSV